MKDLNYFIKKIDSTLLQLDEVPLFTSKKISLQSIESILKEKLLLQNMHVEITGQGFDTTENALKILGSDVNQTCLTVTPLSGNIYFMIDNDDISKMTKTMIAEGKEATFSSTALEQGYYRYILLNALESLKNEPLFDGLSFKIVEDAKTIVENAFFIDVCIEINNVLKVNAKIAITEDFRRSFNEYKKEPSISYIDSIKNDVYLDVGIKAGSTKLLLSELKTIKKGDFVLLDKSNINFEEKTCKATLEVNSNPLFLAKVKKNKIHILDYANYYEEDMQLNDNNNENNLFDDEDFSLDDLTDFDEENKSREIEENININEEENEPLAQENMQEIDTSDVEIKDEKNFSIEKTEVKISFELAKISMSLEKLSKLQPGNFLELGISLDNPINIVVNGKKIGSGELTMLGDKLGVKVLDFGK